MTVALLCLVAFCSGIRTLASAGLGLALLPSRPGTIMTAQAAVTQLGYLIGVVTGAATLGASGYAALGLVRGGASLVSAVLVTRVVDPLHRVDPSPARQARRHRADCTAVDAVYPDSNTSRLMRGRVSCVSLESAGLWQARQPPDAIKALAMLGYGVGRGTWRTVCTCAAAHRLGLAVGADHRLQPRCAR